MASCAQTPRTFLSPVLSSRRLRGRSERPRLSLLCARTPALGLCVCTARSDRSDRPGLADARALLVVDYSLILQQELQQQVLEALVQDQIYQNYQEAVYLVAKVLLMILCL